LLPEKEPAGTLGRRLGGPLTQFGRFGDEKNLSLHHLPYINVLKSKVLVFKNHAMTLA
jgi:hypothetical protein